MIYWEDIHYATGEIIIPLHFAVTMEKMMRIKDQNDNDLKHLNTFYQLETCAPSIQKNGMMGLMLWTKKQKANYFDCICKKMIFLHSKTIVNAKLQNSQQPSKAAQQQRRSCVGMNVWIQYCKNSTTLMTGIQTEKWHFFGIIDMSCVLAIADVFFVLATTEKKNHDQNTDHNCKSSPSAMVALKHKNLLCNEEQTWVQDSKKIIWPNDTHLLLMKRWTQVPIALCIEECRNNNGNDFCLGIFQREVISKQTDLHGDLILNRFWYLLEAEPLLAFQSERFLYEKKSMAHPQSIKLMIRR